MAEKMEKGLLKTIKHVNKNGLLTTLSILRYRRTLSRQPLKVILPDGTIEKNESDQTVVKHCPQKVVNKPIISSNIPPYEKLEENDKRFTSMMTITKSRPMREKKNKILLEGYRLIKDAISCGVKPEIIYFSRDEHLKDLPLENVQLYKVLYKNLSLWSNLTTCPGLMGIFPKPNYEHLNLNRTIDLPLTIVGDNIREPGNLGALLRCAAAVGCRKILLTKGCVDPWEPKVLRGASGAHFKIQILNDIRWEYLQNYVSTGASVYLASNKIPSNENTETEDFEEVHEKSNETYEVNEKGQRMYPEYKNRRLIERIARLPVPSTNYFNINFCNNSDNVVILGGETEGVSKFAYKFLHDCDGRELHIPIFNDVESLNVSVAAGIIIFEIQKQFIQMSSK